jgi:hypothetical protein
MEALVYDEPWDVRRRLRDLGLRIEVFQTAGRAGHLHKASCTPLDPPFIHGTVAWWRTLQSLRVQLTGER